MTSSKRNRCVFCGYQALADYPLAIALDEDQRQERQASYHQRCFDAVDFRLPESQKLVQKEIYDLDVCTRPMSSAWIARNEIGSFSTILEEAPLEDGSGLYMLVTKFRHLPEEIKQYILKQLVPFPEIMALSQTPRLLWQIRQGQVPFGKTTSIQLREAVYVSKIMIAGNHYISSIITRSKLGTKQCQKMDLGQGRVLITRDSIGIRNISRHEDGKHLASDHGLYYSSLELSPGLEGNPRLVGETDGLLLRNVLRIEDAASLSPVPEEWNVSNPPLMDLFVRIGGLTRDSSLSIRLEYVPLGADLDGISACARAGTTIGIFVHRPRKERETYEAYTTFVKKLHSIFDDAELTFMFFPLRSKERVQEVGVRKLTEMGGPTSHRVLTLTTNHGRKSTFGPYIEFEAQTLFDWTTVRPNEGHITGIYHTSVQDVHASFKEVGVLVNNPLACKVSQPPLPLAFDIGPKLGAPSHDWYLDRVTLDDVVSLTICEDRSDKRYQCQCLGLLMTYKDGHKESLGQFRFDKDHSRAAGLDAWEFSSQHSETKQIVVSRICGSSDAAKGWIKIPGTGTLSWWFGIRGSILRLNES